YEYALDYLNKSKNVRAPNSSGLANTLLNLGGLYISMRSYDKSIDFSKQSLKIFEKLDEAEGAAKACNNIGNAYLKKEDLQLAYRYYERALSYEEISPSLRQMIRENIRVIWIEEEKYDKALDAYLDDLRKKELKQENTIISNLNAGILFYRKNEYEQADQYFHDALKGAKSINNKELMSKTMRRMIDNYIFLGNSDSSLAYIDRLAQTEDELKRNFTDAMNMNAYKLRSDNYDTKQRSQQIKITALLMGIIALIGIFISLFAAYREKVKRRDAEKEREQKVKTVLQEVKLKSTEARLEGMLEERKRISDDIHDSVGMMLSSTKLHFESLSKRLDSLEMNQRERFDRAFNMLSLAQKETRRVVHDMANLTLKEHGLKAQIEELVKVIQNTEFNIDLKINGVEDQMDQKIATQVYKIVQELIGNAIKFADASQLDIQIERIENELALQVQDNGKGIAKIEKSTLRSVKGRVKDLGANIKIDSAKGKGTQVLIDQIYLN
ncbi:MAG: tetratricopeptide repeat protein, partial [Bacteroidota bacterium]